MGVYLEDLTYKEILPILARTGKLIDTRKIIEIDLVRCGECKWWNRDGKRKDGKGWCENAICGLTKPNAFCSYGERRTDEENN